eukprot:9801268-Karenia_brevis.AAC.1
MTIEGDILEMKATADDTHFGGEDFDNRIADFCMQDIKRWNRSKDLGSNHGALCRLQTQYEDVKWTLTSPTQAAIEIDSLSDGIDYCDSNVPVEKCMRD